MTIPENIAQELFFDLLRIRRIEEAIADRYSQQKMRCPVHLSIGQEAIAVGVCKNLKKEDMVISNHRAHAHYLAKGGNLKKMLAEIYGKETGCSIGRGGSMHLVDLEKGFYGSTPIVASSIPVGVGLSFATQLKEEKNITTIFLGEGATEEGVVAECLNFAALKGLPLLFVCENKYFSVYSPLCVRQSEKRNRIAIAEANGLKTFEGNGNDIEETYHLTKTAIDHIHSGKGPVFIELETYRYREHCGPNFDTDLSYRSPEEVEKWQEKCPLKNYQEKLQKKQILTDALLQEMEQKISEEIEKAFAFAEESPFPTFDQELEKVYVEHR